ncbi:MAG: recombinase family protein [Candidatus Contendobacter sp.]|jgi:DNA invertase Pin-like site-specific DNA recombinase|nr:recombinase family protein [Candidatus Contendobacter sp.]
MTTKTIAYLRVSTDKQADKGVSLEAQQDKAKAYAGLYDLDLVEVIVDAGESAKSLDRPGLQRALAMLKTGQADALLVVKLDRLTRSVVDLGKLIETYFAPGKAALMSVGEQIDTRSAAGRLVLNILASVSQWERETIGERTSAAMQHKQAKGEYIGGETPYGFDLVNGELIEDEAEQEVIQKAKAYQAEGLSLRKIAAELDKQGIKTRRGSIFAANQIKRMVA